MRTAVHYVLAELLQSIGAIPPPYGHGKWTCPRCNRKTVSVNESSGLFNCFHAGCGFRGNAFTLARELGLLRRLPRDEYLQLRRDREFSHQAAELVAERVRERREKLNATHRQALDLIRLAHSLDPESAETWDALAVAYVALPNVRAELLALETASAADAIAILDGDLERARLLYEAMSYDEGPPSMIPPTQRVEEPDQPEMGNENKEHDFVGWLPLSLAGVTWGAMDRAVMLS